MAKYGIAGRTRELSSDYHNIILKAIWRLCLKKFARFFGFQGLHKFQIEAITHILEKGIDIFVNLPTGYGKSVIHRSCSLTVSPVA